jgi:myo-inositol-1(or 4)-monophosphatase
MLEKLCSILRRAAQEELCTRFTSVSRSLKADGSIVTEADLAMQYRVQAELRQQFPHVAFLGEEMTEQQQLAALNSGRPVWCLDPVDGTSNFAAGIPYFAVSLSLVDKGEVQLAIVYDPMRDEMFSADKSGAYFNGLALQLSDAGLPLKQSIALVDLKRLPKKLQYKLIDETPYASQRSFGSVALDWCWLAKGRVHVYLHGRSKIWDYAAGNYIFTRAGGQSCTLDGDAIFENSMTARSCVGAVDEKLFAEWHRFLEIDVAVEKRE